MRFARISFLTAGLYGILVLTPLYFMADRIGHDAPPAITHLEFYYGFVGVGLLWQVVFLIISRDPVRFRPLMPAAVLEKFVYAVPVAILYLGGQLAASTFWPSMADPVLGVLFVIAYLKTKAADA